MKKLRARAKGKARNERIFDVNPDMITSGFSKILDHMDIPHFRYHDLRHYGASIMHALGVPDAYIMERGGWSSDKAMKEIYRAALSDQAVKQNQLINERFEKMTE